MNLLFNHRHKNKAWALWHRAMFYMDFRSVARILKYRKLREEYYQSLWAQSADHIDADITPDHFGFTKISKGNWATYVKQYEMMFDSPLMLNILGNKALVYELLSQLQAPVVPHQVYTVSSQDLAVSFLQQNTKVVVKPASGTGGGRGVTTHISTAKQLKAATRLAARFDRDLIVEKQIEGQNFRLLFLDGQFIDAIRRDPPVVTGDGSHTIRQLIRMENRRREKDRPFRALSPLVIDNDLKNWMRLNDITLADIPRKNQVVQVKSATNENDSSGNVNITALLSPEIISRCSQIVSDIGVKFAGVDLMCRDITGTFSSENCYIGEVNTTPGLHHHYLIANKSEGCAVAEVALQYLLNNQIGIINSGNPLSSKPKLEAKGSQLRPVLPDNVSKKTRNAIENLEAC